MSSHRDESADPATTTKRAQALLSVRNLVKEYPVRQRGLFRRSKSFVRAVSDVSFDLMRGETLGLVGESGCGKSTLGRCLLRLTDVTSGEVDFGGVDLASLSPAAMRPLRSKLQMVFQDPYASLHPRMRAGEIIAEPLRMKPMTASERTEKVLEALSFVKLDDEAAGRFPHEFSGGQRQRIGIARALVARPDIIILDEPVSALDVSIQAGVLNLLKDLQQELGLSYLFIAHDLSVVRHLCDRVAVMYLGKIVEIGSRHEIYKDPRHPYTQALLSAVPIANLHKEHARKRIVLTGDLPNPAYPPSGCRFRTRCWKVQDVCKTVAPTLEAGLGGHPVACHFPDSVAPST